MLLDGYGRASLQQRAPLAADYYVVVCGGGPAGCAAEQAVSQVVERSIGFRDVDLGILRAELAEQGAIVDWEQG